MRNGLNVKNATLKTDGAATVDRAFIAHVQVPAALAVAAVADGVLAAVNGAAQAITTGFTNPTYPRNITATAGGTAGSIKAVQVVVEGTDMNNDVITETLPAFTVDTPGIVTGSKIFKTVTKVTVPAHDAASATTAIGFGSKLGLPFKLAHNTVLATYFDNAIESTAPTVTVSASALSGNGMTLNSTLDGKVVDAYLIV